LLAEGAGVKGTPGVRALCRARPNIRVRILQSSCCAFAFSGSKSECDRPD
jgi:hypothetical protein